MRDEVITDLDRQIQEALAVDPSPDFKARVRIRLAEEPQRYRVGIGWLLSGVTGLTVVTVLAVFVSSRNDVRPRPADVVAPVAAGNAAVVTAVSPPAHRLLPVPTVTLPAGTQLPTELSAGNDTLGLLPRSTKASWSLRASSTASYWALKTA